MHPSLADGIRLRSVQFYYGSDALGFGSRRSYLEQHHAMAAYFDRKNVVHGCKVLELPDVADRLTAGKVHSEALVELLEGDRYFCRFIPEVEEADGDRSIPKFARPNLMWRGGAGI